MKLILLVSVLASLAVSGVVLASAENQPKEASSKPVAVVRKVTVQLLGKDGAKQAETTVPAVQENQEVEFGASIPLTQIGTRRWRVDFSIDDRGTKQTPVLEVTVYDLDRATLCDSDKGQQVLPMQQILMLNTAYTGPGTYEIYRSLEEKLVIVIE